MTISKAEAERRAREHWPQWRLLLSDMHITYADLDTMDDDDIAEANAALDIYQREMERQNKRSK